MDSSVQIVDISMLRYIPEIVAWAIGIGLAIVIVSRGGGGTGKLFLTGCSLMFLARLTNPIQNMLMKRLVTEQGMTNADIAQALGLVSLPMAILALAGLVCLVWAFWLQFRVRRQDTT